jgi:hypothetical protein
MVFGAGPFGPAAQAPVAISPCNRKAALIRLTVVKARILVAAAALASLCACRSDPVACPAIGYMTGISVDVTAYAPNATVTQVQACWARSCHDYKASPVNNGVTLAMTYDLPDKPVDVTITLGPLTRTVSAVPKVKFARGRECGGDLRGLDLVVAADGSVSTKG